MQKLVFINGSGTQIDLTSGNFGITNWAGLSNTGLNIQTQQVPFEDGGVFLDALMEQREIEVTVAIYDGNNLELRYQKKRELISALNPKLGEGTLIYTNDYLSRQIKAVPQIPLFENKNSNDAGTLKASVAFTCCSPYWEDLEETEVTFQIGEQPIIINNGDINTQAKIEMFTDGVMKPQIKNTSTNQLIEYNGNLEKTLYINTNVGEKQVYSEEINYNVKNINTSSYSICYAKKLKLFVKVGFNSIILSSTDGLMWNYEDSKDYQARSLESVCFSESLSLFVAVGGYGVIITSPDGHNWTEQTSGISESLHSVCYSEFLEKFITVGSNGTILTSPDGHNWTEQTSGISLEIRAICSSEEKQILVAIGHEFVLNSSDGITWTNITYNYHYWVSVCYSRKLELFIAVGGGHIYKSSSGISWVESTTGVSGNANSICYSESLEMFIAVGNDGKIQTSKDGIKWETQESNTTIRLDGVCYSEETGLIIAVGMMGATIVSNDGILWDDRTSIIQNKDLNSICYSKKLNLYAIVGNNGYILTSSDRQNWTLQNSGVNANLMNIIYVEELNIFIALGGSYVFGILTSNNGVDWSRLLYPSILTFYSACYSKDLGLLILVGSEGRIFKSTDGINFSLVRDGAGTFYSVCYSEKKHMFVAVGNNEMIYTSPDGDNWTSRLSGTANLNSVCYSDTMNKFVAVGVGGLILSSNDGFNWETQSISSEQDLHCVCFSSELSMFIAVGDNGIIITSIDGINWTFKSTVLASNLMSAIFTNNNFNIVGSNGLILESIYGLVENEIENITLNSDLDFRLKLGQNRILLERENGGTLVARIKYRQKYIGV